MQSGAVLGGMCGMGLQLTNLRLGSSRDINPCPKRHPVAWPPLQVDFNPLSRIGGRSCVS